MHIKYLLINLFALTVSVKALPDADNDFGLEARDDSDALVQRWDCGHDAKEVYGKCVCHDKQLTWDGKKCVCPKGTTWEYGKCVPNKPSCHKPQVYNPHSKKCECPHGTEWKYGKCIPKCPHVRQMYPQVSPRPILR
ncbi:hypothetical protein NW763_007686 [Fusarium oxysporum]|nr:hypothetical protein NW763_007686 [Fusarium oxysporum]